MSPGSTAAAPGVWGRTPTGWALNLDGSAASRFALPRLEIEESDEGWICRCRLGDGTSRERRSHAGSIAEAQRDAVRLGPGLVEAAPLAEPVVPGSPPELP